MSEFGIKGCCNHTFNFKSFEVMAFSLSFSLGVNEALNTVLGPLGSSLIKGIQVRWTGWQKRFETFTLSG